MAVETSGRRKMAYIAVASLVFLAVGYVTVLRATKAFKQTDLTCYLVAAQSVLRGGADLYSVTNERGWHYNYPPLFAIVMVPLAMLPLFWASLTWYVISVGLLAWTVSMCVGMVGKDPPQRNEWSLYALPVCVMAWPLISALTRGQASVLLMWLVVATFFYGRGGRSALGGLCLAGAIVLKVFPVLLLAYFLWGRAWRLVAATLVGLALGAYVLPGAVLGWQNNLARLHEWAALVAKPAVNASAAETRGQRYQELLDPTKSRNQSLPAVLVRLTGSARAREVAVGIALVMLAVTGLAGGGFHPRSDLPTVGGIIAWLLLAPPVSETHYFVLLILPLTVLVWVATQQPAGSARVAARIALVVFATSNLGKPVEYCGPMLWGTLAVWAALVMAARRGGMGGVSGAAVPAAATP